MTMNRRNFSAAMAAGAVVSRSPPAAWPQPRSAAGAQRRPRAWAVRRRIMLVRGDRAIAGGGTQCHRRAKPADDAARSGGLGRARAGAAGWPDGAGRAFLLRHDRHRGRHASERLGPCLCGGAGAGCGRGLLGAGQDLSDAAGVGRHRFRRRRRTSQRGGFLRDFAGDLPEAKAKVLYAVQEPFQKALLTGKTTMQPGDRNRASMPFRPKTARSIPTSSASWPSAWAPRPSK